MTLNPAKAAPEALALIECTLFPRFNRTGIESRMKRTRRIAQLRSVSFRKQDGLIRLDASASRFWIGGELESIECR